MKLNFLEILSNKNHTADDIAREIVSLETKTDELKSELDKLHTLSKELRAKRICGDPVNTRDIETFREKISELEEDIAVCNETRQSLEARLRDRIKKDNEDDREAVELAIQALKAQEHDQIVEIAKLRGRVEAIRSLMSENARGRFAPHEIDLISGLEKDRIVEDSPRPTLFDKDRDLRKRQFVLKSVNLNAEFETLLSRHRQAGA